VRLEESQLAPIANESSGRLNFRRRGRRSLPKWRHRARHLPLTL